MGVGETMVLSFVAFVFIGLFFLGFFTILDWMVQWLGPFIYCLLRSVYK